MLAASPMAPLPGTRACGPWHYEAFGLRLRSNVALPGLKPVAGATDGAVVEIRLGSLPEQVRRLAVLSGEPHYIDPDGLTEGQPHLVVNRCGDGVYSFAYDSGVQFVVDSTGHAIWGAWGEDLLLEDVALYLLGPILGFLLRLQGVTCLHAGAVVADDRALMVVGPSGAGKSTLTTVLARLGLPVLTDDVLPIVQGCDGLRAVSGYPRLRLRPEVVETLYGDVDAKPRLTPSWERRYLDLSADGLPFHAGSARLGAIYVLDRDECAVVPRIEPVPGHEGLALLVANTYRNELLTPELRRDEFLLLAELVRRVPVRRLRMASDLGALADIGRQIIHDSRRLHV